MSHFTVAVISKPTEDVATQLAPFDEGLEVPHIKTKAEHIQQSKDSIESYKNSYYADYLKDPEAYMEDTKNNPGHQKYIYEEFPLKLNWTDEEHYQDSIQWYLNKDGTPKNPKNFNEDGSTNESYNPNSKWDWYQIGGRWQGMLKLKENQRSGKVGERSLLDEDPTPKGFDSAEVRDIDFEHEEMENFGTFAILKYGEWYERGKMGWWGSVSDEMSDEEWDKKFAKLMKDLEPEDRLTIVDCHI